MNFLKKVESFNRIVVYSILKVTMRTKKVDTPLKINKLSRILILRYDAIGDMIVSIPAIRMIKKFYPDVQIDVVASGRNIAIAKSEPSISNVYLFNGKFSEIIKLSKFKKMNYDMIFSFVFNNKTKSGLVSYFTSGTNSIRIADLEIKRENLYSAFFNAQINLDDIRNKITMLEILCEMAERAIGFGYNPENIEKKLFIEDKFLDKADKFLDNFKSGNVLVFNISSGNSYRTLSVEKNIEIIKSIIDLNYLILIISDKGDSQKAKSIESQINSHNCKVYETGSIFDVFAIINKAAKVFTPDTSIVHVASSFNKPVFVLYSSLASYIREWIPYNSVYDVIQSEKGQPCENIPTKEIVQKLSEFLKK